ncbi:hypothetical protein OH76DRAFT_1205566 [Lentinus brumalis]|uniref:Uncharacterized protein n=1 Tax=Lentinus brumalis TaxID=2498619 RepID=A0A371CSR6_9APHY|nr:hypothetical protein OH76DRAFT_1205566 [Polyporus brumalis]
MVCCLPVEEVGRTIEARAAFPAALRLAALAATAGRPSQSPRGRERAPYKREVRLDWFRRPVPLLTASRCIQGSSCLLTFEVVRGGCGTQAPRLTATTSSSFAPPRRVKHSRCGMQESSRVRTKEYYMRPSPSFDPPRRVQAACRSSPKCGHSSTGQEYQQDAVLQASGGTLSSVSTPELPADRLQPPALRRHQSKCRHTCYDALGAAPASVKTACPGDPRVAA